MNTLSKTIDQQFIRSGRRIRFTNFVDASSLAFERQAKETLPEASMEQQLLYLSHTRREYYLMQITANDGKPAAQICVYVGRPKLLPGFAMASVPSLGLARNAAEENFALTMLSDLMGGVPGVMTLRLQAQRFESETLAEFESQATRAGFFRAEAMGPVHTLTLDLKKTPEELLATFNQKTRSKIRHSSKNRIQVLPLANEAFMEVCETAMNESRKRSGGEGTDFDFKAPFAMATLHPNHAKVLGLFLESNPEKPLAYVIGYSSGERCEYASAGAFGDPELRSMPYNYFLMWELMNWARSTGAKIMDLGGVSEGGENDPLQGIARFKRSFNATEIEIGREMVRVIRPVRFKVYCAIKSVLSGFRWKNPVSLKVEVQPKTIGMMPTYD